MPYHHTQRRSSILTVVLFVAVFGAAFLSQRTLWPSVAVMVVLIAVEIVFKSLTVEVSGQELRWYFGPGFWSYRLPLDQVATVAVVRNHWWNGFGIRMRSGFRLYNVSGLDAVELRLNSNEIRRIGTDDPQGLAQALQAAGARELTRKDRRPRLQAHFTRTM
jgi:hypothetical protein